jgi:hypothetical protein
MNFLRSLERWDLGFESHSKAWMSVYVYSVLCSLVCRLQYPCDGLIPPSKESYRLYIDEEIEKAATVHIGLTAI